MSRIVRPVRAWAEYDAWQVLVGKGPYCKTYHIPQTGEGDPFVGVYSGVADAVRSLPAISLPNIGPLRSLRVLYENGWTLELGPESGRTTTASDGWFWYLHEDKDAPEIPHGRFTEDTDSEAVERALIAAAAWFTQQQGGDL